jgi:chromosome segregation ATPase
MSQSLMIRDGDKLASKFTPEAIAAKEAALGMSGIIARVSNAAEQQTAVEAQRALRAAISAAEKARKEFKEPVIEFGKQIDATAKEYKAELEEEELRVAKLVGDFQQAELAKARAAEAARVLEQQKLEAERQAEIRRVAQEEAAKLAAIQKQADEAARAVREASNAEARAKAEEIQRDLDRQRELAQAESLKQMEATQSAYNEKSAEAAERPQAAPARVEGQRVVEDYEITVTDVHTLARCHPGCVKIEPRLAEIKAQLKMGVKIQGITVKEVVRASVNTRRQPLTIEA